MPRCQICTKDEDDFLFARLEWNIKKIAGKVLRESLDKDCIIALLDESQIKELMDLGYSVVPDEFDDDPYPE